MDWMQSPFYKKGLLKKFKTVIFQIIHFPGNYRFVIPDISGDDLLVALRDCREKIRNVLMG